MEELIRYLEQPKYDERAASWVNAALTHLHDYQHHPSPRLLAAASLALMEAARYEKDSLRQWLQSIAHELQRRAWMS